ncbi:MAG: DUF1761 domain-containing protein [Candidatus Omnitrophica bacterium]|nr:DUF1761 domain-containing protein [Candidatus Omnitrophota bacterium]
MEGTLIVEFSSLNYLAILLAGLSGYVLGALWYSRTGFGKTWLKRMGLEGDDLEEPIGPMALAMLSSLIKAFALALVVQAFGAKSFLDGAGVGLLIGLGLNATSIFSDHLFGQWDFQLFVIRAGYQVCFSTLAGGILGFWR